MTPKQRYCAYRRYIRALMSNALRLLPEEIRQIDLAQDAELVKKVILSLDHVN